MTSIEGFLSGPMDDHTPLWKFVTKLKKLKGEEEIGSGNVVIAFESFNGSYSRVKAHLKRTRN